MIMKFWILLLIAGLLLLWSFSRERFEVDPVCKTLGKKEIREGTAIRVYTKEECDQLDGRFVGNGECLKKGGGSYTWDCRNVVDPPPGATGATGATGAAATRATGTTQGTTAGGTTGGSSTTSAAPNAGPVGDTGRGKQIYGPVFTEYGASSAGNGQDTSKTNQYPELLGGVGDVTSVRTPSGIQNPSQSWLLSQSGALPSTASLGSDANAAYFPYSRSPGDQDLIPDPYRLSRNYSTASYSSKTDPVPFLTDFSAFFK